MSYRIKGWKNLREFSSSPLTLSLVEDADSYPLVQDFQVVTDPEMSGGRYRGRGQQGVLARREVRTQGTRGWWGRDGAQAGPRVTHT